MSIIANNAYLLNQIVTYYVLNGLWIGLNKSSKTPSFRYKNLLYRISIHENIEKRPIRTLFLMIS